jgi:hypothetical protein
LIRLNILLLVILTTSACIKAAPLVPTTQGPFRFSGTVSALNGTQIGRPISGAQLTIVSGVNANTKSSTDSGGHFVFPSLDNGKFNLTISAPGYASATPVVELFEDTEVDFVLKPH